MEEKFKKFKEFKFEESEKWQIYLSNLHPTPSYKLIDKFKRKWYRMNIDKGFDITYVEPEESSVPNNTQGTSNNSSGPSRPSFGNVHYPEFPPRNPSTNSFKVQLLLIVIYICLIPFYYFDFQCYIPLWLCFLTGLFSRNGPPKFSKEYLTFIVKDNDLHNLIYSFFPAFSGDSTLLLKVPLLLWCIYLMGDLLKVLTRQSTSAIPKMLFRMAASISKKEQYILLLKSDLEIFIGFYVIVIIFLGWGSFFVPLLYWQNMQFRYGLHMYTKDGFSRFGRSLDYLSRPRIPFFIRFPCMGLRKIGSYLGSMQERQSASQASGSGTGSGSRCNIF